uniref:Mab-21 domain-containing protein n=1 Tax=Macrostomum lignano TaxID=282301 RepID=A0A1I8GZY0_9PLAT
GLRLHKALVDSGFVYGRASLQAAVADHLQGLISNYSNNESSKRLHLCGSFAEGWGSSVCRLGGRVDEDSDIDISEYVDDRLYHLSGKCQCNSDVGVKSINKSAAETSDERADELAANTENEDKTTLKYEKGHVWFSGYAAHPARTQYGCLGRPAMDMALMYCCCAYPKVDIFESPGYLSPQLLKQLREATELPNACPLVGASLPDMEGKQLRISTKWLELLLVRSFTDVQGQLYTILKYLFKRVINKRGGQLKSFHAKTLAFRMLRETPPDQWRPERLPELTAEALDKLAEDLRRTGPGIGMHSFFFNDSPLYLKRSNNLPSSADDKRPTLRAVLDVRNSLDQVLTEFLGHLQPLRPNAALDYHPFMLLPRSKQIKQILGSKDSARQKPPQSKPTAQPKYHELHE